MNYIYIFGTILFTVYGQLILKWRITRYGSLPELLPEKLLFLFRVLIDPFIIAGFIASLFWMATINEFSPIHSLWRRWSVK